LHPAKLAKFIEILIRKREESERLIFQKNFKIFLPVKKKLLLLHPLWETTKSEKQKEHVPRHIELTAVSKEISRQKNKSNRIEY
jgi:hypothetical protein